MRNIEKLLKEKNVTMYQLAKAIGESNPRTRYLVKENTFSETIMLKKVAVFLGCEIEDLLDTQKNTKNVEEKGTK